MFNKYTWCRLPLLCLRSKQRIMFTGIFSFGKGTQLFIFIYFCLFVFVFGYLLLHSLTFVEDWNTCSPCKQVFAPTTTLTRWCKYFYADNFLTHLQAIFSYTFIIRFLDGELMNTMSLVHSLRAQTFHCHNRFKFFHSHKAA